MVQVLFDETPIIFDKILAQKIGFGEAIVLQQVNYWVEYSRKNGNKFFEGRHWTYNSIKNWRENDFPFFSIQQVTKIFNNLEKTGYLIVGNFNKMARDKTKWYSVDKDKLKDLGIEFKNKSSLLFTEAPVIVDRILAQKIGIKNAIVLQKINYLIEKNKDNKKLFIDDRYWTYKSIREWQSQDFPFFSTGTIRRVFEYLEQELKLLDSKTLNRDGMVRTKWHSINYDRLYKLGQIIEKDKEKTKKECAKTANAFAQNDVMHSPKIDEAFAQNDVMHLLKNGEPLPNNYTKSNTNNNINNSIYQSNNINKQDIFLDKEDETNISNYEKLVYKNIDIDSIPTDYKDTAKGLINIILDNLYLYNKNSNVLKYVAGEKLPISMIAKRLLQIDTNILITCIDNLRRANITGNYVSYALTTMYNSVATASLQLENQINKNQNEFFERLEKEPKENKELDDDDILNYDWLNNL